LQPKSGLSTRKPASLEKRHTERQQQGGRRRQRDGRFRFARSLFASQFARFRGVASGDLSAQFRTMPPCWRELDIGSGEKSAGILDAIWGGVQIFHAVIFLN